ncbi:Phosphate-selective porin O and P OS=Desulfobacca acetoxidans (strain ATCC 700848 / DSM 11109 / ASRB2) GN=Desac_2826 PE=4 SV=1: Porin_O_P [Gemmataceae bacterium]|nr:Phosphate-selective porin O and P OS=Desulfobacca acetoxidans (strain ATCC 700848 / DSM 11109 / ASRB2) GN=Desac_2826 PE=4 SV=1: Porin_O_P [Gemmataceae bacterium]VTT96980.1 Phosphate-selective porin O and P OS=Desulfobacca acetoxidans (strain ATCC 700848 / DSM 11109 / ASRB2) GN=Desac_2826 PE=4 SV=1: Porin_O_P [Gemmataceae bacterium]
MLMPFPRGRTGAVPVALLATLIAATLASAQDPPPVAPADPAPEAAPPGAELLPPPTPVTKEDVTRLVEQMLKDREEKAKKAEADKKVKDVLDRRMTARWNNGLQFESPDKNFKMHVGGVIQFDMGWYAASPAEKRSIGVFNNYVDPNLALQDGMDFRRARLRMSGLAYEQIEFFAQYEFANATDLRQRTLGIENDAGVANPVLTNFDPAETTGFNEVYIGLTKLPFHGNFRVGRHRESLNFVTATADNYQVWLERGLMFEAFNGNTNFSNGITMSNLYLDGRAYTLFGFFQQNSFSNRQFATLGDGNYVYDSRVTCLPLWNEEAELWGHVGFDSSYRNLSQNAVRLRARPNVRIGSGFQVPSIVDTGVVFSRDGQQIYNLELAGACGPWTFAAEGTLCAITNAYTGGLPGPDGTLPDGARARGTYFASGAYIELLRFLTPDHRGYVKERPGYARVVPRNRFRFLKGEDGRWLFDTGAWEVGVRYDYVDLTNAGVNGGTAHGVTAAVNWYLTSNARVQTNVAWMSRGFNPNDTAGRLPGDFTALGIRFNADY